MRRATQNGVVLVIAVTAATAAVNGLFLNFVKPWLRWPIVVAAVVLLGIGLYGFLVEDRAGRRHGAAAEVHDDGHGHGTRGPRVGWLLVIPFLLLGVVVPPPLGSYAAQQDDGIAVQSAEGLGALPPGDPAELTLAEFQARALYDAGSLDGRTVRMTGFSSPGEDGRWVLTRMSLNCCAADGFAVKVAVEGAPEVETDEWVEVTGRFDETAQRVAGPGSLPVVVVEDLRRVAAPDNPYE